MSSFGIFHVALYVFPFLICLLKHQRSLCEGDGVNVSDILHGQGVAGDRFPNLLSLWQ